MMMFFSHARCGRPMSIKINRMTARDYLQDLLEVLILTTAKNGEVDHYAVDVIVLIGSNYELFQVVLVDLAQFVGETQIC